MKNRAILLDYGGVVADHYCQPATRQLAELLGVDERELDSLVSERTPHGAAFRLNRIGPEEFWETVATKLKSLSSSFDWKEAQELWAETYVPNRQVLTLMQDLRLTRAWKVGILSNMDRCRFDHVMGLMDWSAWCDVFVSSWEIGAMKPALKPYEFSIEALGCGAEPESVLYVDDRAEHVRAAMLAGCQGCVFESVEALRLRTSGG